MFSKSQKHLEDPRQTDPMPSVLSGFEGFGATAFRFRRRLLHCDIALKETDSESLSCGLGGFWVLGVPIGHRPLSSSSLWFIFRIL